MAATPHVRSDYPTSADEMEARLAGVAAALDADGIPLRLLPGGEIALNVVGGLAPEELGRFGLGGSRRHLLLEFPYAGWRLSLELVVRELASRGVAAVLAHPERNGDVQRAPRRLARSSRPARSSR